jgi:predicted site-specific integrase-resolvase
VTPDPNEFSLSPGDVAERLGVNPKTVTRWAKAGIIDCLVLPSGHRRYSEASIEAMKKRAEERAARQAL